MDANRKLSSLLIIDDEPLILDILTEMLAPLTDRIERAGNGVEALKKLATNRVDCIVCDVNMAPMNGIEFLKHLLKENSLPSSFFFFSAHASEENLSSLLSPKIKLIQKPEFNQLKLAIGSTLKE